jgi:hypothetical protein
MKKQKLKLHEILNLDIELNGFVDPKTREVKVEGLLNQILSHNAKFNLKISSKNISIEKESINEIQQDLIQKYGSEDKNGNIGLSMFLDEVDEKGYNKINPKFVSYQEEWNEFLSSNEREVEFYELTRDDLKDVKTKDNYVIIDEYFVKKDA